MARLTLILGVLATVIYLLDGFRFMLNEWRNWRNKSKWLVVMGLVLLPTYSSATELATDNFNTGGPGLSANWTTVSGLNAPQIVSSVVQPKVVGGSDSFAIYTGVSWPNEQYAQLEVTTLNTSAGRIAGVILRGITTARTGYECRVAGPLGATATLEIYKYVAGVGTLLANSGATATVNSTDVLKCTAIVSAIKLYINGVERLSTHDRTLTSGSTGILAYTSAGATTDTQIDNFAAGDIPFPTPTIRAAASCSVADILDQIDQAAPTGDTVNVPAGSCTWTTTVALTPSLVVDRGVALSGTTSCTGTPVTCVDGTIINDGTATTSGSDPLWMLGTSSRVTGFSFKDPRSVADAKPMLFMQCASCRLDHNSFTQTNSVSAPHGVLVYSTPTTTSLIDHNYFKDLNGDTDVHGAASDDANPGDFSWRSPLTPGDGNAVYLEDNNYDHTAGTVLDGAFDTYDGARFVFRYNTVTNTNSGGHGLDSGGFRSVLSAEIYRNTYQALGTAIYTWWNSRGGYHSVWQNTISASGGSYNDFMWLQNYRGDTVSCAVCSLPLCDGSYVADQNTSGQEGYACRDQVGRGPETDYLNDWPVDTVTPTFSEPLFPGYSWGNNYRGVAPTIADVFVGSGDGNHTRVQTYHILNNRDFYMEVASFDGTVGTGTGVLASRPATCTVGVAYFATDQGSWNVSGNGDGSGLLYICTATNTWTLSYTPYTYPHPLQGSTDTPFPSPVVIARVLRWMEIAAFVTGMGWHFRKPLLAVSLSAIAGCGTIYQLAPRSYETVKVVSKDSAVKVLTVFNHLTKTRE